MTKTLIRQANETELPFIYSTWLRSYKFNSSFAKNINNTVFYDFHHKLIEGILKRGANVLVSCDPSAPEVIYGYLVVELQPSLGRIAHFGYVKKAFRGLGIFKDLIEAQELNLNSAQFTHYTTKADKFVKMYQTLTYNPYLV